MVRILKRLCRQRSVSSWGCVFRGALLYEASSQDSVQPLFPSPPPAAPRQGDISATEIGSGPVAVSCQLSAVCCPAVPLSTVHCPAVHCSAAHCSDVRCPLSHCPAVRCPAVRCPLSAAPLPLSAVPLITVRCPLSAVRCPPRSAPSSRNSAVIHERTKSSLGYRRGQSS